MANNKTKKVAAIIGYLLVAVLLIAAVGFVFKYTNGLTDDFKTFYVEYDGNTILYDMEKDLPIEKPLRFDVKYTFDTLDKNSEPKGYKLSVEPSVTPETNFEFTVDGGTQLFNSGKDVIKDYTKCFDIVKADDGFTLTLHTDTTMQTVLEKAYSGKTVAVPETVDLREKYYFSLNISSYNGKSKIVIPFRISAFSLVLDPENIVL